MPKTTWKPARDPRDAATLEFEIADPARRPVTGALWLPERPRPDGALIACGHGASGDRYQTPIPYLARKLGAEGYPVLAIDGPVHGLRQVGPGGRAALGAEMARRPDIVDDMVRDWAVAIAAARARAGSGDGPLGFFGLSMGSIFGIPALAARSDVRVAVLGLLGSSGPPNFGGPLTRRLLDDAARITCPVLYLMQLEDELFDRKGYLEVFDALASEDKRLHANPGLHPAVPHEELRHTVAFLRAHLEGHGERRVIDPLSA